MVAAQAAGGVVSHVERCAYPHLVAISQKSEAVTDTPMLRNLKLAAGELE